MNLLTAQQQEILFKPFGRELIKRMASAAEKIEEFSMDKNAMKEAHDVLDQMFARSPCLDQPKCDDTLLKAVVKKQTKKVEKTKKKVSVAVMDTSDEEDDKQIANETTPVKDKKSKRGRPKKEEKKVSAEDLIASMMSEPKEKLIVKKVSKSQEKLQKQKLKLFNDINDSNKQLETELLDETVGLSMDVADLKDMLKDVKKKVKQRQKIVEKTAVAKAKSSKVKANFTCNKRLQNNDGEDLKGLNGSFLRYKINKDTLEKVKVSPNNYTGEAIICFDALEVKAPKEKVPKKKVLKCFRAYNKQNTASKSIVWKPYHEDEKKRNKTEAKYLKTLVPVDQWKFAEKAGDTADRLTQNPYVKDQIVEQLEELSEEEFEEEKVSIVQKPVEKTVEVVEKPAEKISKKEDDEFTIDGEEEEEEEEDDEFTIDGAEDDEFTIDGAEEFAHFEYPNKNLLKAPNQQVWDKDEKTMLGYYNENTGEIVDNLESDDESDDDDEDAFTEDW
jgi:hypothetical protein